MGAVYLAVQHPLEREVAVKILEVDGSEQSADFDARFRREASVLARLQHPNTVRVFDHGRDGNRFYMVMELVTGRTLGEILREDGPIEPLRAIAILRQICAALDEAHRAGIVHRDLKPANIMITERAGADFVKVLDFGLVKIEGSTDSTRTGVVMGTPKYMAPEQINGSGIDRRTDLYSLGIIAYLMLTGERPYRGDTATTILAAHLAVPPMRLKDKGFAAPDCLEWTLQRCMEKHKEDRFASAEQLVHALNACELALAHPQLARLTLALDDGLTVMPSELKPCDKGFSGTLPPDSTLITGIPRVPSPSGGGTLRGVLIGVIVTAFLGGLVFAAAIALLVVGRAMTGETGGTPIEIPDVQPEPDVAPEPRPDPEPDVAPQPQPDPEPDIAPEPPPEPVRPKPVRPKPVRPKPVPKPDDGLILDR
ncbi:MAG: serine/threonine protein kinase [Alphaproteobacteria bacterium]|nr:serine/threonine protein kinase [Alphaproteobacteria bacterium]